MKNIYKLDINFLNEITIKEESNNSEIFQIYERNLKLLTNLNVRIGEKIKISPIDDEYYNIEKRYPTILIVKDIIHDFFNSCIIVYLGK